MKVPAITVRLFQCVLHLWVILFLLTAMPLADLLWLDPVSPALPYTGWRFHLVHPLGSWLPLSMAGVLLVIALGLSFRGLWRSSGPVHALLLWFAYTALMHVAFTASSGGQQLISNLLFWNIPLSFLSGGTTSGEGFRAWLGSAGLWAIRLQLLVAYAASAMHKLEGSQWMDGSALGIVASDPAFGPAWLMGSPLLPVISWAMLGFQLTFPAAVWWRPTRLAWLLFGVGFHLGTALWMDLPDMGTAFLVAYVPWLSERDLRAWSVWRSGLASKR